MSNISELREQVAALNTELSQVWARLEVVEGILLRYIEKPNVEDKGFPLSRIEDPPRTPIGFKPPKKRK